MEQKMFRSYMLLITFAVFLVLVVNKFDKIVQNIMVFVGLLKPFFIGFFIAFILNIPYMAIYGGLCRLNHNIRFQKRNKLLAVIGAYLLCFGILSGIVSIIIPELGKSIVALMNNSEIYKQNFQNALLWMGQSALSPLTDLDWNHVFAMLEQELRALAEQVMNLLKLLFPQIFDVTTSILHGVTNVGIGLVVSVYLLIGKDSLCHQMKRMTYAFLPEKLADECIDVCRLMNQCFSNFISGQLLEACILGMLCFIGMHIFGFEYAFLISILIGVTAVIPIIGAFIGTIPSVFLLFLVDPMQAVWFVVFILVLQQIEGHIIYPKVVGESVGLPALWVIMGIVIGGGLGGVFGMLLGVPVFTVLYKLLSRLVQSKLNQKRIKI